MKVNSVLFVLQLPPPIHGASMVNEGIRKSKTINEKFNTEYINLTTARDIHDIGKNSFSKQLKVLKIYLVLIKTLFSRKFDLCYVTLSPHGIAFAKDSLVILILKLLRQKICVHLHGKGIQDTISSSFLKKKYYKFIFSNLFVIHLSPLLKYDLKNLVRPDRIFIIPNGIKKPKKQLEQKTGDTNNILYLSNMQESKGSMVLLKAANELRSRKIRFHISFVGKWHSNPEFKTLFNKYIEENHLENYVSYLGPKYGKEKEELFSTHSIFALPTFYRNECFPISILEAMSYGLVPVSTHEGAIASIIEPSNGYLVNRKDEVDLADKLESLLTNPKMVQSKSQASLKKFDKLYTIEKFETNLVQVFNKIISL